jgi:hypothetical protein
MLRFDIPPVPANVIRWEAFLTSVIALLALLLTPWLLLILILQGFVRGFLGHYRCPSHRLWRTLFERWGCAGKLENAGAKMFAGKILMIASVVGFGLWLANIALWKIPCVILVIFASLEWAVSFCAACWVYSAWYRFFPPRT